jgi:Flp pilus assembly protein TadG
MISRWLRLGDRRGNVALIAALCAPIMMLMVGAAIDYGYALNINQRLNEAADTAVLSAISPAIAQGAGTYAIAYNNGNMATVARNTFATNTSALPISVTPSVNVQSNTSSANIISYTATLTYSASVPTFFAGLIGMSTIPISGHATATTTPLVYIRYYVLIDNSQSMGIGSTTTDMQNLYTRIANNGQGTGGEKGCVFGCHVAESTQANSNEAYAHNLVSYSKTGSYSTATGYVDNGGYITLRIDSANSAVDSMIQMAINDENSTSPNISIGLYTMNSYPSASVTQVFAPTTSLSSYKNVAVDLGSNTATGLGDSDLPDQLTYFTQHYLPTQQGTGASASSPLNFVFIITDGLTDIYDSTGACTDHHCTGPLLSSYCSQLKNAATVGVIYTTYNTIYSDPIYPTNPSCAPLECAYSILVSPFLSPTDSITSNLTACATSPSLFFSASNGPALVTALQALFATSLQSVRLTQ